MEHKKIRLTIFHPFLLGLYPLVALISFNITQIRIEEVWRSFAWVLIALVVLFLLAYLLIKDWRKAGLICTLSLTLFFSYGHIFRLIEGKTVAGILVGRADFLMALWAAIWISASWWIIRKMSESAAGSWTRFLNAVSLIALIFPVVQLVAFSFRSIRVSTSPSEEIFGPVSLPATLPSDLPDIYYIIVDGYGRADVLGELYDFDNTEFTDFLTERGFYVATQSHSNYGQTALSLSSSLNFAYINEYAAHLAGGSTSREPLGKVIRQSRLEEVLTQAGYQFVALASGYNVTEFTDADWYLNQGNYLNTFETMWLTNSAAAVIMNVIQPVWYRTRLLTNLDTLAHMPETGSPRFVFAHILLPHPPFVFGPEGEALPPKSFKEGNYYEGTTDEYIQGYRGQVAFLNKKLMEVVSGILDSSDSKPIIILQGDHGPGAYLNWDYMEENCFKERMSILNAYYLPGAPEGLVYDSITPVNTFRLVLDTYLQTDLGTLEDRSYFSLWNSLYELEEVSDQLNSCHF